MLCDKCHKREAKIYCTEIMNGKKKEQYLCEQCAAEYASYQMNGSEIKKDLQTNSLFSGLLEKVYQSQDVNVQEVPKCSNCKMSYSEFLKMGKFGCTECYKTFGNVLERSLKQVQGSDSHHGKIPKGFVTEADKMIGSISEVDKLTLKLQYAIEKEEYEEAAKLRDIIRELKKKEAEEVSREEMNNA